MPETGFVTDGMVFIGSGMQDPRLAQAASGEL
jgi:hypothetical protein